MKGSKRNIGCLCLMLFCGNLFAQQDEVQQNLQKSFLMRMWNDENRATEEATKLGYKALTLLAHNEYRLNQRFAEDLLKAGTGPIGLSYEVMTECQGIYDKCNIIYGQLDEMMLNLDHFNFAEEVKKYVSEVVDETKVLATDGWLLVAGGVFSMKDNERMERLNQLRSDAIRLSNKLDALIRLLKVMDLRSKKSDQAIRELISP